MALKITIQNLDQIVARRWKYSSEKKRSLATNVFSCINGKEPDELPESLDLEDGEAQQWRDFVTDLRLKREESKTKRNIDNLNNNVKSMIELMNNKDLRDHLSVDQYEELSKSLSELKKIVTSNKNYVKRKSN